MSSTWCVSLNFIKFERLFGNACMCEYVYITLNHSHLYVTGVRAKETGREMLSCWGVCVCVWVCLSMCYWNNECCDPDFTTVHCWRLREQSRLSNSYESFINMRKREGGRDRSLKKATIAIFLISNPWETLKKTLWTYGCVCTNASLSSPSQFQLIYQSNFWPITYNRLIEAVWMLLRLSSSDSWASANEMILILCADHVLCTVVNCVIICTVHTSLHAYSRWCVEGVVEGERDVRMLQFTLAV